MRKFCVYKHTTPSGKVYIGITSRKPKERWDSGWGYFSQSYFYNAINKYGWNNIKHEILFNNLTEEEAYIKEKELIKLYKSNIRKYGYNISSGGEKSAFGIKMTKERKQKISQRLKGRKVNDETKQKISKANKGINNGMFGKNHNDKIKQYISECASKRVACYDKNDNLIKIYNSIKEATLELTNKINQSSISAVCKGKRKTAYGYKWKYADEELQK